MNEYLEKLIKKYRDAPGYIWEHELMIAEAMKAQRQACAEAYKRNCNDNFKEFSSQTMNAILNAEVIV